MILPYRGLLWIAVTSHNEDDPLFAVVTDETGHSQRSVVFKGLYLRPLTEVTS